MTESTVVHLNGGLGNRLNRVFEFIRTSHIFFWPLNNHCCMRWSELFDSPDLDGRIIYSENLLPKNRRDIKYHWNFHGEVNEDVQGFIRSLKPCKAASEKILKLPRNTKGYYIRALHPDSKYKNRLVNVPETAFLCSDSKKQRDYSSCLQVKGQNYLKSDGFNQRGQKDNNRTKEHYIDVLADWFTLFQCSEIHEYGLNFKSLAHKSHHSTFIDAHRIVGIKVINHYND